MRRRSSSPSGNSPENDEEKGKGAVGGGRRRVGFTDLGEWKYVFRGLGFWGGSHYTGPNAGNRALPGWTWGMVIRPEWDFFFYCRIELKVFFFNIILYLRSCISILSIWIERKRR